MAVLVASQESPGLIMQQSKLVYAGNAPAGFKPGDQEESHCVFQIHEPAHGERAKELGLDFKNSVRDCIKMARLIYEDSGFYPWTEYHKILAMN